MTNTEEVKDNVELSAEVHDLESNGIGQKIEDPDDMNFGMDDIEDVVEEEIKALTIPHNHMVFSKGEILPFLSVANIHSKLGQDVYSRSLFFNREEGTKIAFVYNNNMVYVRQLVNTVLNEKQILNPYVVDLNSVSKIVAFAQGSVPFVEIETSLFVYMYGGNIFMETHNVEKKLYEAYKFKSQVNSTFEVNGEEFIARLKSLYILVANGTRAEERAVYFEKDNAFIYSGNVIGNFPGKFEHFTLQMVDIESIVWFFKNAKDLIRVNLYDSEIEFLYKNTHQMVLPRKKLELADDVKGMSIVVKDGVKVDAQVIYDIVNVLDHVPSNSGVVNLLSKEYGFNIVSPDRSGKSESAFPVQATQIGTGVSDSLRVSIKSLRTYMKAFKGLVSVGIKSGKLYVQSDSGNIVVSGNIINNS